LTPLAPLVSVVTPAYNEERYVRECIESVLAQSYRNWDYTIVDNASTDHTFEIAQEYAAKDERIRIVRNDSTVPAIANHNLAFHQVSPAAKYCKLVAADDWIYPQCLEQMVRLAEAHPRVAIVGAYSQSGQRVDPGEFPFASDVVSGREVARLYLSRGPHLVGAPTALLFRADVVRQGKDFYRSAAMNADAAACLEVLEDNDYGFVPQVLTYTRVREMSLTSLNNRVNSYLATMLEFLLELGPRYFDESELRERVRDQLRYYYNELGRQAIRNRDPEFWAFQRRRLAELGHPLSRVRLAVNALFYGLEAAVCRVRGKL
jgi:glycosyltransferase involved in cell wall biosynthesis